MNKYKAINKDLWNQLAALHVGTDFYDMDGFRNGRSSLKQIELDLLGDVKGKKVLHLQCHFGQDSISLARMGAQVTGVDISDKAIEIARNLSREMGVEANISFVCSDVLSLDRALDDTFDLIFTSYGVLVWLQDLAEWAAIVRHFLKPSGQFLLVEFHPLMTAMNETFTGLEYSYFNSGVVVEKESGSYADPNDQTVQGESATWDHSLDEVLNALWHAGLLITGFREYPYSPYCLSKHWVATERGYEVKGLEGKVPMTYSVSATVNP